jgi:low affinity Fe/Cu permease
MLRGHDFRLVRGFTLGLEVMSLLLMRYRNGIPKMNEHEGVFNEFFRKLAKKSSLLAGSPWTFCTAVAIIAIWGMTGPLFGFSDTWQLIINTGTTIVTFLMVFLIQNTQNRDSRAVQLKLDELINSIKNARNKFIDLEDLSDEELETLQKQFKRLQNNDNETEDSANDEARH